MATSRGQRPSRAHPLAPYVRSLSAYDYCPGGEGIHRGLPSTTLAVMIPHGGRVDIGWAGRPQSRRSLDSVVSGLHTGPAVIRQSGRQQGVWLTLTPLGGRAVFGVPAAALAGQIADLGEVAPAMLHLPEQLTAAASTRDRLQLVERMLMRALAAQDRRAPDLAPVLAAVTRTTRVQAAADLLGCSRRHLSGVFRSEFGLTPKEYQRIVRFEKSRRWLAAGGGAASLSAVAAAAGYADQAHWTREWRAMAGCTPTQWLASERSADG